MSTVAQVDCKAKLTEDQICEIIPAYDALMVRSGTQVTNRIIEKGTKLKIIGRAGVGVDNVNVERATELGIFVVNSPQGNTVAAAEHTLALLFALSRSVPAADASVRGGKWDRNRFMGTQLQHKALGIVGLGQVGCHVAKVAREMGMELFVYDPFVADEKAKALGCTLCSIEELLQQSDYVTLHVPLMESTKYLIRSETLAMMKPTARLINTSRGGVINEQDLCEALKAGKLAGAALDVFEKEAAMSLDHVLLNTPNLILTPHLGASTSEAQVNVAVDVAQQIKETLLGSLPASAVNIPGIRAAELSAVRPLLNCCTALGRLAAQVLMGAVEQISVALEGPDYAEAKGEPVLLAVANGVLSTFTAHRVNFVNVRNLATQHKIQMAVSKECCHAKNSVRVELRNKEDAAVVRGTITEEGEVLLKKFKGIPMFMVLPESTKEKPAYLFYSLHTDAPGSLSAVFAILYSHKVNVANCHLGRADRAGTSLGMCVFHLDSPLSSDVITEIRNLPNVMECNACLSPQ
eukprot:GHVQ01020125.1.p1 GENE.GHVQ01020125.1~~GHVQ01020125.1.p1  ORF type:complete len:521 (-),score=64.57 GHVQ01020125.1:498-2060(-)